MDRSIEESKEWMSVPAFGDWDNLQVNPEYSMNFSKIRENRKQSKSDYCRIPFESEADILSRSVAPVAAIPTPAVQLRPSPPEKKTFMSHFFCCGN